MGGGTGDLGRAPAARLGIFAAVRVLRANGRKVTGACLLDGGVWKALGEGGARGVDLDVLFCLEDLDGLLEARKGIELHRDTAPMIG